MFNLRWKSLLRMYHGVPLLLFFWVFFIAIVRCGNNFDFTDHLEFVYSSRYILLSLLFIPSVLILMRSFRVKRRSSRILEGWFKLRCGHCECDGYIDLDELILILHCLVDFANDILQKVVSGVCGCSMHSALKDRAVKGWKTWSLLPLMPVWVKESLKSNPIKYNKNLNIIE